MATYVNDLRLTELATGEGSGTWGVTTNTNLELIGEALGYGTQNCFATDADATTTVADGASDPARSLYFKVTSSATLTATRVLTIAPNTVSRVMFIENATTGSQSITISQGSGANVTIATGKTAVVYLDGAGSTAAVVDALALVDPGVTDTLAEVLVAGNATGGTDIAVGTGDDITFADNSKAIFGAGSDLQIGHDGSVSFITDSGTGDLYIQGSSAIRLTNPAGNESFAVFNDNGAALLYYDNGVSLSTTSTGIDVTGTVTADGLTVDGATVVEKAAVNYSTGVFSAPHIALKASVQPDDNDGFVGATFATSDSDNYGWSAGAERTTAGAGDFVLTQHFNSVTGTQYMRLYSGGDISFYEDTGTTAKFFWDASAESLGIGTSSPSTTLTVAGTGDSETGVTATHSRSGVGYTLLLNNTNNGANKGSGIKWQGGGFDTAAIIGRSDATAASADAPGYLTFHTSNDGSEDLAERMRITSAGNVGIGTSSPGNIFKIFNTADSDGVNVENTNASFSNSGLFVNNTASTGGNLLRLRSSGSDKVVVLGTGNVGIGTSSPAEKLSIEDGDIIVQNDTKVTFGYRGTSASTALAFRDRFVGADRLIIDSSGNVGIGTDSPDSKFVVSEGASATGLEINPLDASERIDIYGFDRGSNVYRDLRFIADKFRVETGTSSASERFRIDSSGNLLVGKTATTFATEGIVVFSPSDTNGSRINITNDGGEALNLNRNTSDGDLAIFYKGTTTVGSIGTTAGDIQIGSGDTALRFQASTDSVFPAQASGGGRGSAIDLGLSSVPFKDLYLSGKAQADSYQFAQNSSATGATEAVYRPTTGQMAFKTNSSEAMRIDSSGTLLIGRSASFTSTHTVEIEGLGSSECLALNARADGEALTVYRDGNSVGSIGTNTGILYIGSGEGTDAYLGFGNDIIRPVTSAGASRDAAISLGYTGMRFKDLYLSGGVYLGGTGAANHLDDYEEGSFTPLIGGASSAPTVSYDTARFGYYTKVGLMVHVTMRMRTDSVSGGSGILEIKNLPFTGTDNYPGNVTISFTNAWLGEPPVGGYVVPSSTKVYLTYKTSVTGELENYVQVADLGTGANSNDVIMSVVYRAA